VRVPLARTCLEHGAAQAVRVELSLLHAPEQRGLTPEALTANGAAPACTGRAALTSHAA
jgi:hypothetical protein